MSGFPELFVCTENCKDWEVERNGKVLFVGSRAEAFEFCRGWLDQKNLQLISPGARVGFKGTN